MLLTSNQCLVLGIYPIVSCNIHESFCVTVATTIGTVVAYKLVPMRSLGQDSWKIAAALMGSYIGGGNCKC